jgi:hypothetical protein
MQIFYFLVILAFNPLYGAERSEQASTSRTVDLVHQKLSSSVTGFSYQIDKFFGSKRAEDRANGTQVKLAYITSKSEAQDLKHGGIVKFRLNLPYLESLLKVSFSTDSDEPKKPLPKISEAKTKEPVSPKVKVPPPLPPKPRSWGININTGVKVEIPPQFFTNFRIRKSFFLGKWEFRGSQDIFWFSRSGFGETTTLDFDRTINSQLLFRLRNSATWTDTEDEFISGHGPILFWQLDQKKAFSFSVTAGGSSKPLWQINSYQIAVNYRQLLYNRWFYLETGPTIDYQRSVEWSPVLSYFLKLEVIIGNY